MAARESSGVAAPDRPGTTGEADAGASAELVVVARRRFGMWLLAVAVLVFVAWVGYQLLTNDGFQWEVVARYVFSETILSGLVLTVELTVICMVIAVVLGTFLAVMRLSQNAILVSVANGYIWFFRGTPVLVQLIFWYNLASLFDELTLGVPFGGPKFLFWDANVVITPMVAAIIGFGLNEAAYQAEIVRGGLISVDAGQREAAKALGYGSGRTLWRIVLPQAMRAIIPPTGNQTIGMLKYTSLASVVSLGELTRSAESIYSRTFETIPLLIVISLWYLLLTTLLSIGQHYIERHYLRGTQQHPDLPSFGASFRTAVRRALVREKGASG